MQIKEVMTPRVESVRTDETLADALTRMKTIDRDILPVFENDRCVGVVSERSVTEKARSLGLAASSTRVTEAMSRSVITLPEGVEVEAALTTINKQPEHDRLRYVLIVDDERRPAGMVSVAALQRHVRGEEPDAGEFAVEAVESISSIADYQEDAVEYMSDESFPASDPPPPPSRMSRDPQDK